MTPLPRWLGMSIAFHVALAVGVWASARTTLSSTAQTHPTVLIISLVDASDIRSTPSRVVPTRPRVLVEATPRIAPTTRDIPLADVPQADAPPSVPDPGPPALHQRELTDPGSAETQPSLDPSSSEEAGFNPPTADSSPPAAQPDPASGVGAVVDHYRPLVLAILERAKRYPLLAQRWGVEGTVEIAFTIAQDGRLSEPEVVATSRHSVLDDATVDMVRRIGSLPPPPDRNPLRFAASIQYTLDDTMPSASTKGATP